MTLRKTILSVLLFSASTFVAASDNTSNNISQLYSTPFFGFNSISNDVNDIDSDHQFSVGLDLGSKFNEDWGYRLRLEMISGQDDDSGHSTSGRNIGIDTLYYPKENAYIFAGVRNAKVMNGGISPVVGTGIEFNMTKNWDIRLEAGFMAETNLESDIFFSNIGFTYRFEQQSVQKQPAPSIAIKKHTNIIEYVTLDVKFKHDSSVIEPGFNEDLASIAKILKSQSDTSIIIEGHTSLVGTDEYNQVLSEKRANAVVDNLVKKYGVSRYQLKAIGYGESMPVSKIKGPEGDRENRRVIAVIKKRVISN